MWRVPSSACNDHLDTISSYEPQVVLGLVRRHEESD
jgi:hypothetical protein